MPSPHFLLTLLVRNAGTAQKCRGVARGIGDFRFPVYLARNSF